MPASERVRGKKERHAYAIVSNGVVAPLVVVEFN
jgi:hypothetical protein